MTCIPKQVNLPLRAHAGGSRTLPRLFSLCALIYLGLYALEAPVRYLLFLVGKDGAILARDALILLPLAALAIRQTWQGRPHPAFLVFALLMAFHGLVLLGTVGSLRGALFGAKLFMNVLFGFFAAALVAPDRQTRLCLLLIWLVTLTGLLLDKSGAAFPWTGLRTTIGDLAVDVSHDWEIQDPLARRAAGFTRSSISAATLLPLLAIVLMGTIDRLFPRACIALATAAAVFLTTQKGALFAFPPVALACCARPRLRLPTLRLLCLASLALSIALPFLTLGLSVPHGDGVFSIASFAMRISDTWPGALDWIAHHQMLGFGVGLGGISGPQRLYAPDATNPADNMFLLLYANFGVFALLYLGLLGALILRARADDGRQMTPALALLAFAFGYGCVLSVLEDQAAALFFGAAAGTVWQHARPLRENRPLMASA